MPLYEYECEQCHEVHFHIRPISEWREDSKCPKCGSHARKIISSSSDRREWEPYVDENLGDEPVMVESRSHRKQLLKERGLESCYRHKPGMPGQWV
jgi:putative FmdB family regulatory protein